ncbi:Gfo/Idh/MocA family oxidoreductase [Leptospira sp. 201903071]|uniref:Gfo/Idh/MocA family oxidoreductase n=1 Tax=Leptospira ainazelensis TaxID=2810034 RepID=UPI0019654D54|nr:Gfo/Idh/MocA family oxidoreductase [Leptospira ainazelensis]MBM9501969.1 Gfo/Idh/MocA family oxidoreductase [Leptospira ainazelensis]
MEIVNRSRGKTSANFEPFPEKVSLIGGGRWARVLAEVLIAQVSPSVEITIHSIHNARSLSSWVSKMDIGNRIQVESNWPRLRKGASTVVIVVNAARDHAEAIRYALSAEVPVLVEKPLTLSFESSRELINTAQIQGTPFAASHVFLFARYIENFAKLVKEDGEISSLELHWIDPRSEVRYGELKKYDPFLPIYADVLPHVFSILDFILPDRKTECKNLDLSRGGATLELEILFGDVPCKIHLERNGESRTRSIQVKTKTNVIRLDFSREPGIISTGTNEISGDTEWEVGKKPVASMLASFLRWAAGGEYDHRLSVELGLRINWMIDQVSVFYNAAMRSWLKTKLLESSYSIDNDILYTLAEILHLEKSDPSEIWVKRILEQLRKRLFEENDVSFSEMLETIRVYHSEKEN